MYNFTAFELKDALLRAQRRGVRVRVVCDAREASEGNSMIPVLITSGVPVKQLQKSGQGLMHHKFMVVDKEVLITGSYNWTVSAEKRNQENILVLSDAPAVRAYQNEFDRLWKKK